MNKEDYKGQELDKIAYDVRICSSLLFLMGGAVQDNGSGLCPSTEIVSDSLYCVASLLEKISLKLEEI